MSDSTKDKIIHTAIERFNESGYGAVTLFDIAKTMGISRGNLAYHFADKDALLNEIIKRMWEEIAKYRSESRRLPSFANLQREAEMLFVVQQKYAFVFLDIQVMLHPQVKSQIRHMARQSVEDNLATISYAIANNNMKPESFPGLYYNIAQTTWMIAFFWFAQCVLRDNKDAAEGQRMIWSILLPHFTEKGMKAFESHFGKEYLDSLGPKFSQVTHSLNPF